MPRKVRQDIAGYNVALASLAVEYTRALENTTRSKVDYQGALDRIQWLLDLCRREQREMLSKARTEGGFRAPQQQRAGSGTTRAKRERGASPERRAATAR